MTREELQQLILDAADGLLEPGQMKLLDKGLELYPDLRDDYELLMKTPSPSIACDSRMSDERMFASLENLKRSIHAIRPRESFEQISLIWFWRGALAASLALFALTGMISFYQSGTAENTGYEPIVEETIYPVEESLADTYEIYLNELSSEE